MKKKKIKQSKGSLYFLVVMLIVYFILLMIDSNKTFLSVEYVWVIIKEIIPILFIVYIFMLLMSFINENKLKRYIDRAPMLLKYSLMAVLGTLSHGPIYAWYPFLGDLHEKGISKGSVSTFLYARGIKLTLLPMLISFFDLKFAIILTITTFLFSILQGMIMDIAQKND